MQILVITAGPNGKSERFTSRRWHIRCKALRRETRRYRYPTITLDLAGIL